jgi:hypothetical protein
MKRAALLIGLCTAAGCVQVPKDAFVLTPELLKQRQVETRKYSGISESELLVACSNVLQDLGFTLENSEVKLGVLTASKQRDATNATEIVGAILLAFLGGSAMAVSKDQTIRVSLVVRPAILSTGAYSTSEHFVRVTFQRIVRRTDNSVYSETLSNAELFQQFFEKVSQSVFIEGQKL